MTDITSSQKRKWREDNLLRERQEHPEPPLWEDAPTYQEARPNNYPPDLCKKCDAPLWKSGLCHDHWQERQTKKKAHQREFERTRRVEYEPVRYQPTPVDTELYEARQRFPLVPQMSDEELLRFHREHPRGWYEEALTQCQERER